jgi:Spy/CpxP family protein refolding chaperone
MKKAIAIGVAFLLCLSTAEVMAQQGGHKGPHDRGPHHGKKHCDGLWFGHLEHLKEVLNLTDDQVKKISDINLASKKKMLTYKEKLAPKKIQLKRLLLEDQVDLAAVRKLLQEMGAIKIELRMTMIEHRLAIEKVLTREQRDKLRQERMRMRKKHGHKHDRK